MQTAEEDLKSLMLSGLEGDAAAHAALLSALVPLLRSFFRRRLHDAVDATIRSPDIARRFTELGADPQFGTPAEFAAYVADDLAKWARLAKEAGLKAD